METNIDNNTSVEIQNMEKAFEKQNEVMDEVIYQMYNYDLYGRYKDPDFTNNTDYSDIFEKNKDFHVDMIQSLENNSERIQNTYDYNSAIYKNQVNTNERIQKQKDLVQERYDKMVDNIEKDHYYHNKYRYNYYKYRKIVKCLYVFVAYILGIFTITIINKGFPFFINNALYTLFLFILTLLFVGFIFYNIYDIYIRNKNMFFEYDDNWEPPELDESKSSSKDKDKISNEDKEKC